MTSAIEFFRFGDVSVRVQKCEYNAALRDMVTNDAFKTGGRSVRSINGEDVVCYRLFSLVQGNPSLPINQGSFEPLVQNGAVINTTATASYPALLGSTCGKSACYPSMVVYRSYELA